MSRSTLPVAMTFVLYLFQSCVRISAGGLLADAGPVAIDEGCAPAAWTGILETRWYFADVGVRRSYIRRCESEDAAEMIAGFEGQNDVLYVQLPVGRVLNEFARVGDHFSSRPKHSVSRKTQARSGNHASRLILRCRRGKSLRQDRNKKKKKKDD